MSRHRLPARERHQQILEMATKLFACQGYQGTTTKQIAAAAGVNEALVFRHFPRKEGLYWAVIEAKCRARGARESLHRELRAGGRDDEAFARLAEGILQRNTNDTTLTRLLLFSALEQHRLSHRFFRTYVADYYEELARHIRRRIRAGAFRRTNALLAARGFLGMVVYHYLIQELFGGQRYQRIAPRRACRTFVDIWLEGMRAGRPARLV